jgi:ParB family chromosome partitioning protein
MFANRLVSGIPPQSVSQLARDIEADGGSVIGVYRDPLGGHWQVIAGLPIDKVEPTPFQRDLSVGHVERLANAIDALDRFLDPIVAVRSAGLYWTPNGNHRLAALRQLGARSIVALVAPEESLAYRILSLNTEKAHNLKERALEAIRMAQALSDMDPKGKERDFATEFEEAPLLTLGLCYQQKGRFAGSPFHSVLKRIDRFLPDPLPEALAVRTERAASVVELEEAVNESVAELKAQGFDNPYLKNLIVSRINPLRFKRGAKGEFDATIRKMIAAARTFDVTKMRGIRE